MRTVEARIVKAFTQAGTGGNPAGVVLDASGLTAADRQKIATRLRYSETAFVDRNASGQFRLQFFTPNRQIERCGHATVGTLGLLKQLGQIPEAATRVEIAGETITILFEGSRVFLEQSAPRFEALSPEDGATVRESLGITSSDLMAEFPPQIVSTGNRFVLVGVKHQKILSSLVPDQAAIEALSEKLDTIGYYVFALDTKVDLATTRMFAPRYGIPEESATGMAAGPLAGALVERLGTRASSFSIEQGRFMRPPSVSRLFARVLGGPGKAEKVQIGGDISVAGQKALTVDF